MSEFKELVDRALHAAAAVPRDATWSPELDRRVELREVLARLPRELQHCSRAELEARIHDKRLLSASLAWRWGASSIIFSGATGRGKTSAVAHLVRRLCAEATQLGGEVFERARFIRWQECRALSRVARESKFGTGTPEEVIRCQNARLLILDDLGATDDRETLEVIMQVRNERAWPTITTTGITPKELLATFGDALMRRLIECGGRRGVVVNAMKEASKQ